MNKFEKYISSKLRENEVLTFRVINSKQNGMSFYALKLAEILNNDLVGEKQ